MHCNATTDDWQLPWFHNEPRVVPFIWQPLCRTEPPGMPLILHPHAGLTSPLSRTPETANFVIKICSLRVEIISFRGLQVNSKGERDDMSLKSKVCNNA